MTKKADDLLHKLQDAEIAYFQAQERCDHWDMEGDGSGHDCCFHLSEARILRQAAQRAYSKATGR
jgi:hypothetical protein